MPDYVVKTTFKGVDNTSAVLAAMERAAAQYGGTARASIRGVGREADHASTALRNASKHGYNFGAIVKGIVAANILRGGFGMITSSIGKVGSEFLDFDDTLVSAAAKFDDIGVKSKNFGSELKKLKDDVRGFALGTRYGAADISKSMEAFAEAGWGKAATEGLTPYFLKAATANRVKDLADFGDSVLGIFQGFSLKTGDATKDSSAFVKILDQITQGALDARGGVQNLKESLKVLAPIWQTTESTASTIAFASVLQNAGFSDDMIGTAGKNFKMRLARPDILAALKNDGVDLVDPKTGKMVDALTAYKKISNRMKELGIKPGSARDIGIQQTLFGLYAVAGNQSIMQHLEDYEKEIKKIEEASKNIAGDTADIMNQYSSLAKLSMIVGAAMDKGFAVLDQYSGKPGGGLTYMFEKIKNFNMTPWIEGFNVGTKAAWGMYKVLEPFIPLLPYLTGLFVGWKVAVGAVSLAKLIGQGMKLIGVARGIGQTFSIIAQWAGIALPSIMGIAAGFTAIFSVGSALYSLFTGKDNPISRLAQSLGIVPELEHDANGKGKDNPISRLAQSLGIVPELEHDANGKVIGYKEKPAPTPNEKEAAGKYSFGSFWNGTLNIAGAPPGSSLTSSTGSLPMLVNMGVNK